MHAYKSNFKQDCIILIWDYITNIQCQYLGHIKRNEHVKKLTSPFKCFKHNSAQRFGNSSESFGPKSYLRISDGEL